MRKSFEEAVCPKIDAISSLLLSLSVQWIATHPYIFLCHPIYRPYRHTYLTAKRSPWNHSHQEITMLAVPLLLAFWVAYGLAQTQLSQLNQGVNITDMNLSDLPQCAQDCLNDSAAEQAQGGCSAIDIKCLCSNSQYVGVLACCLDTKCSADDQKKAVDFNSGLCTRVNVSIPNFLGCSPGSNPFSNSTDQADTSNATAKTGPSGLSTGAKAGIGAGIGVAAAVAIASLIGVILYRKRKINEINRFSSLQYQSSFMSPTETKRGSMATTAPLYGPSYGSAPQTSDPKQPPAELPSPPPSAPLPLRPEDRPPLTSDELWFSGPTMTGSAGAQAGAPAPGMREVGQPPAEMPGDTQINQYHPAMLSTSPETAHDEALGHHPVTMSPISPEGSGPGAFGHQSEPVSPFRNDGRSGERAGT